MEGGLLAGEWGRILTGVREKDYLHECGGRATHRNVEKDYSQEYEGRVTHSSVEEGLLTGVWGKDYSQECGKGFSQEQG